MYRAQLQDKNCPPVHNNCSITLPVLFLNSVCVCVFSSHSFWTSTDVPAGVTQEEGNTGFNRSPPVGHFYFQFLVFQ